MGRTGGPLRKDGDDYEHDRLSYTVMVNADQYLTEKECQVRLFVAES